MMQLTWSGNWGRGNLTQTLDCDNTTANIFAGIIFCLTDIFPTVFNRHTHKCESHLGTHEGHLVFGTFLNFPVPFEPGDFYLRAASYLAI